MLERKDELLKRVPEGGTEWRNIEKRIDVMVSRQKQRAASSGRAVRRIGPADAHNDSQAAELEKTRDLSRAIVHGASSCAPL
jgi:hypothetical protein